VQIASDVNTTGGDFVARDKNIAGDDVGRDKIVSAGVVHIYNAPAPPASAEADDAPAAGDSPYQGLPYFDVGDAGRFFGREQLTAELVAALAPAAQRAQQRFLAVVGASGSGKSSLVRAGLVASLQRGSVPGIDVTMPKGCRHWPTYILIPSARPLESLAVALTRHVESVTAATTLIDDLRGDPRSLHLYASRLLSGAPANRLLLVVDQFEELFTLCRDLNEQRAFVDALLSAALDYDQTVVVITLRADFYAHCARFARLRTALDSYQKYIGPMSRGEMQAAIELPAGQGQWTLESGLVRQMLDDVEDEPGSLPLLSHALDETWQRRRARRLTLAGYVAAGGVKGAIATTADATYSTFSPTQRAIARTIFLRLTELGEGVQDTRRRVAPAELQLQQTTAEQVSAVLKALADARLVTTDANEVQVAHEAVIREWPLLREWLADDREGLRIHRRLTEAAQEWQANGGGDPNDLYRGNRLHQAQEWAAAHPADLNEVEQVFLQASQAEAAAQLAREAALAAEREADRRREVEQARTLADAQQRRARTFRWAAIITGVLLVLALAAAWRAVDQQGVAQDNAATSQAESTRAADAALAADANAATAQAESTRALAAEGTSAARQVEAETARQDAESAATVALVAQATAEAEKARADQSASEAETEKARAEAQSRRARAGELSVLAQNFIDPQHNTSDQALLLARDAVLTTLAVDGYVTTNADAALRQAVNSAVWRKSLPDARRSHQGSVNSVRISPDGQAILSASSDGTVRLWRAGDLVPLRVLSGHTTTVWSAAYSPDGATIVSASEDNTVRIWDAATGDELRQLSGHTSSVWSAAYSPDGATIVSASSDNTVRIWVARIQDLLEMAEARIQRPAHVLTEAERRQFGLE
jgi:hypothetical protein